MVLSASGMGACKTVPDEDLLSGTLDPHSAASRARLDSAQKAFSSSKSEDDPGGPGDLAMTAFYHGGGDLSMKEFNTNDKALKGFGGVRDFNGGKAFMGANKNFEKEMSPLGGLTSDVANQAAAFEGSKTFFGKGYGTKVYQPRGRGLRIPIFDKPKITPVYELIDTSENPKPEPVSVGDIRKLLNR